MYILKISWLFFLLVIAVIDGAVIKGTLQFKMLHANKKMLLSSKSNMVLRMADMLRHVEEIL